MKLSQRALIELQERMDRVALACYDDHQRIMCKGGQYDHHHWEPKQIICMCGEWEWPFEECQPVKVAWGR